MQAENFPDRNWYAVKVFFNKVFRMEDILSDMGLETYLPVQKVQLKGRAHMLAARRLAQTDEYHRGDARYIQEGPVIYERRPLINALIFVKASPEEIVQVSGRLRDEQIMGRSSGFVYKTADWKEYAAIPDKQMETFRLVVESGQSGLEFYSADEFVLKEGDKVKVLEGPLAGAEGYIKRIRKNRRLLVCIEGVIAVATSYIPEKYLERIGTK
ncbi:MAG: hypothetical protein IJ753_00890 [Bacteroidales bacterium]|nr:hypothetical protein [Bacteroidales bacterium]